MFPTLSQHNLDCSGVERHVKAIRGDSLMETAKDNQINLPAVCGGQFFFISSELPISFISVSAF